MHGMIRAKRPSAPAQTFRLRVNPAFPLPTDILSAQGELAITLGPLSSLRNKDSVLQFQNPDFQFRVLRRASLTGASAAS